MDIPAFKLTDYQDEGSDSDVLADRTRHTSSTSKAVIKTSVESVTTHAEELNAVLQQGQSASTERLGCMKRMLHGNCDKPSCKYSHNEVMQTALDMRDKLEAYIKTHSGASAGKPFTPAVLRRDHSCNP